MEHLRWTNNAKEYMYKQDWAGSLRDRWLLANMPPQVLRFIYCDVSYWGEDALEWESLRQYRKNKRETLRLLVGTELTPEFNTPEEERERVREQRQRIAPKTGGAALKLVSIQVPPDTLRYHEELQAALEEHEAITKASFTDWQGFIKNDQGEAEIVDLHRKRFDVKFDHEPLWSPIAPVELKIPLRSRKESGKNPKEMQTTVVCPDLQLPFISEEALDIFYQISSVVKPDNFVQLGDAIDLTAYSRFIDKEIYATTTQAALIQTLKFFTTLRQIAPASKISYLSGNHEQRLTRDILVNHRQNFGLRPADDPDGDALISIPRMVGLKSVDVEYIDGYPNNRYWINDNLQIVHGTITGRNESKRVNFHEKISTIFGHTHRLNHDIETINRRGGADFRHTYGSGCLSRIDKHVPSTNSGYDDRGVPIGSHHENWQNGFIVVTHNNSQFFVEQIHIDTFNGYQTMFRGKVYEPKID